MTLHDIVIYGEDKPCHLHITNGIIDEIAYEQPPAATKDELHLECNRAVALPGLINSHDHLEFNCYPSLGNKIYTNYRAWGPHIQSAYADTIRLVRKIPVSLRITWGLYKNLFNGFTTVINHGEKLDIPDDLITVCQHGHHLHSPAFEDGWKWKLRNPFRKGPVIIHTGEGTDAEAVREIDELIKANWLRKKLVAIHGVAMNEEQAGSFEGVVWCPASNYFFLGKTAPVDQLKKHTRVVFGTDSTLTSSWNIHEHYKLAERSGMVTEKELLSMLTELPASLWNLSDRGSIRVGTKADLILVRPGTSIFNVEPSSILLVIQGGKIRLADERVNWQPPTSGSPFSRVRMGSSVKYVQGQPLAIAREIKKYFPSFQTPFVEDHE